MIFTENRSAFSEDIFAAAERENNSKRRNLIVNKLQGKHVPAKASLSLKLFAALADSFVIKGTENTMVIGFAETATAIGTAIAERLGAVKYIQTTREYYPPDMKIVSFSEEHSHAVNQELYSRDGQNIFGGINEIIFVDDELTTGKTILNFIEKLRPIVPECHFSAASIVNGMNAENLDRFGREDIGVYYLFKADDSLEMLSKELDIVRSPDLSAGERKKIQVIDAGAIPDPRLSVLTEGYVSSCRKAVSEILPHLNGYNKIDVIGTEEFMYPALLLSEALEREGADALTHSVTRSPIVPSESEGYPLFSRIKLKSLYDRERTTYLYNIAPADAAVIFTDAAGADEDTAAEIASYMKSENIFLARSDSV